MYSSETENAWMKLAKRHFTSPFLFIALARPNYVQCLICMSFFMLLQTAFNDCIRPYMNKWAIWIQCVQQENRPTTTKQQLEKKNRKKCITQFQPVPYDMGCVWCICCVCCACCFVHKLHEIGVFMIHVQVMFTISRSSFIAELRVHFGVGDGIY